MAKLSRITQKLFGSTAGSNQIGQFGSLAAGSPTYTNNPATIQGLSNYLQGWFGAVVGGNSPAIEDLNAIHFLNSYQLGYIFQAGIPEYDGSTVYYTNSLCMGSTGVVYKSSIDNNTGHTPGAGTQWIVTRAAVPLNSPINGTSSGSFSTTSASFVTVTGSATIVTSGRPVMIYLKNDLSTNLASVGPSQISGSGTIGGRYQFLRDGVSLGPVNWPALTATSAFVSPGSLLTIDDTVTAGSHVYTLQVSNFGAGSNGVIVNNCAISVYEL